MRCPTNHAVASAAAILLVAAGAASSARGDGASYDKTFIVAGSSDDAKISAGGVLQTWAGGGPNGTQFHNITPDVPVSYVPCKTRTSMMNINGGFKISDTGKTGATGYSSGTISTMDSDSDVNKADGSIFVSAIFHINSPFTVRQGNTTAQVMLQDVSTTYLRGNAIPGAIKDAHDCHSADSFTAANITGTKRYSATTAAGQPSLTLLAKNSVPLASGRMQSKKDALNDPMFVTVNDLTSGQSTTEIVMHETIDANKADYRIDDNGIELIITPSDPASFVDLRFSSADSAWVTDGYTYFARLDSSGFSAGGATPPSGWDVTTSGGVMRAFFAFGPDGNPYDRVTVRPPDSLFTLGHDYSYDAGASDGALAMLTPEPACGIALAPLLLLWRRRTRAARGCESSVMPKDAKLQATRLTL